MKHFNTHQTRILSNPQARQLWLGLVLTACNLFLLFSTFQSSAQTTLAQWTYEPLQGAIATPTPNTGIYSVTATSSLVGSMSGPGTATGSTTGCSQTTGTTAWAIATANPGTTNESSGAQFKFSTVGYQNIKFNYDQRFSNTAVRTVRIQYTLDGTSWNNFTIDTIINYTSGCNDRGSVDNGRIDIGTPVGANVSDGWSRRSIDFSSIAAANNNPNFGVRIVAAHYSTTGQFRQANSVGTVATAGTWRFDNVIGTGTAIPVAIPSIVITPTGGGNAVTEGGATDTFMVALNTAPNANVVVTGTPDAQVNITPAVLTFTSSNWNTPQTVIVSAVDDNLFEGNHTGTISYTVSSADLSYNNITVAPVSVNVTDNDLAHTVAFVRADTTVSESATSVKIWLKVTAAGNASGSVDLLISGASNATSNVDYSVPSTTLNIPANAALNEIFGFDVTINDDANAESDEYIICKLSNAIGLNITTTGIRQHTLYIKDNDKAAPAASNQLNLSFVSSFSNGASGANSLEISAYDSASKRIFVANSVGNKLDIINFADPSAPVLISSVNLSLAPFNGAINSVDVFNGIVALALEGLTDKQANGKVVFTDINGVYISEAAAGAMPDMITFNHAGTKVYTANEGEPNTAYTNDPVGSITVVDISGGVVTPSATTIGFAAYNGQEAILRAQGIRIYGITQPGSVPSTAAQDFEPEYITISDDDSKAWVTLQENNALVELDLTSNTIIKLIPLGYKDHSDVNNPFDVSDQTFGINLSTFNVKGMYEPDAIAHYTSGGSLYLLTANEGDSRAYTGFNEETRVNALTLDPTAYPNAADIKNNAVLGRLTVTNKLGDTDNDGDIDQIYCLGGRSFSIWNPAAVSPLVYDSKDDMERITSTNATYSQFFNMSNTIANTAIKNRSDDKGPEPEGIAVGKIGGRNYAFISLERIGGVMVYDITNPASPVYVTYANSRTIAGGDRGAEGIIFVPASQSPNGKNLVMLSNEISSTLSVFEIAPCTAPGIASIANIGSTSICPGNFVKLYHTDNNATYTRQWLKDGVAIAGATDSVYNATTIGSYRLVTFNSTGCVDTSAVITVTTIPAATVNLSVSTNTGSETAGTVVTVTATASAPVCGNQSVSLDVSGTDITAGDYTLSNVTITILDGQTNGSVTFTIVNDNVVEATETAMLSINNPSSGLILGGTITQNITISDFIVHFSMKAFLGGAYDPQAGLMHDSLRNKQLIPLIEPYSMSPFNRPQIVFPGGETVSPSLLSITGTDAIVDWVYIEVRSGANANQIVATKRALIQRDGDVVDTNGSTNIFLPGLATGQYFISLKHRNHLGIMTASAITLNQVPALIDFTQPSYPVWVNSQITVNPPRKISGSAALMIAGDANFNKNVRYNGLSNDKETVLAVVGIATPNNVVNGYRPEDVNLDGQVKYNNLNNDRSFIGLQIGVANPNLILSQHTPN